MECKEGPVLKCLKQHTGHVVSSKKARLAKVVFGLITIYIYDTFGE